MHWLRRLITNNLIEKIFALLLAIMLWVTIASETISEIGMQVPLEYRNVPDQMEIVGDMTNTVELRLRGSANRIREVSPSSVSTSVDLRRIALGESVIQITHQNVQTPTGIEVVRVDPSRVRLQLERTTSKVVPVVPKVQGRPGEGFEVDQILVSPSVVQVQGPESNISRLESVSTVPVNIDGKSAEVMVNLDLDVPDPAVRIQQPAGVQIRVVFKPKSQD